MEGIELKWWKGMTTFKESITTDDDLTTPIGLQDAMDDLLPPPVHVQDMATAYDPADNREDKEKAGDGNATDDTEDDYCINATAAQWQRGADAAAEAENRAGAAGEVDIDVDDDEDLLDVEEFENNDVMYLRDPVA